MVSESIVRFSSDEDVWRRAIRRAAARPYVVEYVTTRRDAKGVDLHFFKVSSASMLGDWHWVVTFETATGHAVSCDCQAGQRNVVCAHAALILVERGVLTDPDAPDLLPAA